MNHDASDSPPRERDESLPMSGDHPKNVESESSVPGIAPGSLPIETVAEAHRSVRAGSPFAIDPAPQRPVEVVYDVGPLRYTAMGAVAASAMVVAFGLAAAWWFPAGGTLIAALGCVLSIFGLYSHYRYTATGLLVLHLGVFIYSYSQSLG